MGEILESSKVSGGEVLISILGTLTGGFLKGGGSKGGVNRA